MDAGIKVLTSRYELARRIAADEVSESWTGVDSYQTEYLIKLWPFRGESPDPFQRALWDSELRIMYRVGSSPGADQSVLVIRDAGVDREIKAFAMVLEAPGSGYETLADALGNRKNFSWLRSRDVYRDAENRRQLWLGLQHLANGLRILHEQHVLHRNVSPEAVFFDSQVGTASFRLGGFEWSLRLGVPAAKSPPPEMYWSSPPEFFSDKPAYRPETDWYAFGVLAARCLLDIEAYGSEPLGERHRHIIHQVEQAGQSLSDLESTFLKQLIATEPRDRLTYHPEIHTTIQDIVDRLEYGARGEDNRSLVLTINPTHSVKLATKAQEHGFLPQPDSPNTPYSPVNPLHLARLREFLQQDLDSAQLFKGRTERSCVLNGRFLALRITPYRDPRTQNYTWAYAYSENVSPVIYREGDPDPVDLPSGRVVVWTTAELQHVSTRQNTQSWQRYLPKANLIGLDAGLTRFHDFIRCTNQLELLIRDAEIFGYEIVTYSEPEEGFDRIVIRELGRQREPMDTVKIKGGLVEHLEREIESGKPNCDLVILTDLEEDSLYVTRRVNELEAWQITEIDGQKKAITLQRHQGTELPKPSVKGYARTWGMFGQVDLIRRRKQAIDRLQKHSYLLRSLAVPGHVYMDTGPTASFPYKLDVSVVDETKQAVIEDILRVRPIYALQGPPGTGKTTLVAHLVREIMADDPASQILITAQAHGAVDVLRTKVRDEAFKDVPVEEQPLAVRLGSRRGENETTEDSKENVSLRVLNSARDRLTNRKNRTPLQDGWLQAIDHLLKGQGGRDMQWQRSWNDFCELVRRGASLTYCTTSAGDLEELADGRQSFDWSIIEEACKAHGFDLALPLEAGHRWLLIGDQNQLPPYRFEDYTKLIEQLDKAVEALDKLGRGGGLLDSEWIQRWKTLEIADRQAFEGYANEWLNTFAKIFESTYQATGKKTTDDALGAMSGMLVGQYRMHPTIGDLISKTYYRSQLINRTVESGGAPKSNVLHPFTSPAGVEGKAIVWIDVPWSAEHPETRERTPQYTNPTEVAVVGDFFRKLEAADHDTQSPPLKLVVLSPYTQQVIAINRAFFRGELQLPGGVQPTQDLRGRRNSNRSKSQIAYTVDSFQGNQADIVVISLVRNNEKHAGGGLGFLSSSARMNVLLSRSQRLLVLVGSWKFFQYQVSGVNPADQSALLWHLWQVMTLLGEWFTTGRALKIDASSLRSIQ